jgi:hypothetical protein
MNPGVPVSCLAVSFIHVCLMCPCELNGCDRGDTSFMLWAILCQCTVACQSLVCASAHLGMFQRQIHIAMVSILVHTFPSTAFFTLLQRREALVQAYLLFYYFFPNAEKSLYSHNKNKSVLYFTIYFKYFHYEAWISPTWARSIQPLSKTKAAGDAFRTRISYSHTSPPFQPHPQMKTRPCIRKSISSSCSSEVHSTARLHTRLCIPSGRPFWLFDRRHSPAAFDNNLLSALLDKRFLEKNRMHRHF